MRRIMVIERADPPRRRLSRVARRAQLIEAAQDVFGELGYRGATMDLVAQRSGVARSLLYLHFDSLEDLYLECVRSARAELDARFLNASILNQGDPREQLRTGITAYFRFVQERGRSWEVLSGGGETPGGRVGEIASELRFRTADQIAALFHMAVPTVDLENTSAYAHVVSGGGDQLAHWWRKHPHVALETVVDHLLTVAWDGLRQLADPQRA